MKHKIDKSSLLAFFIYLLLTAMSSAGIAQSKSDKTDIAKANEAIEKMKTEDPELASFFSKSAGYAVFPSVGKGGLGVGGAHGNGILFVGDGPVGKCSLSQVSIGFQAGGQSYIEIVFFEDQRALDNFKEGKLKLAAQASAVAVTEGASADVDYNDGVAIFTMAKGGLMYEASVGGQKFDYKPF